MGDAALSWLEFFEPSGIPYAVAIGIVTALAAGFVRRSYERLGERFADRRLVIQQTGSLVRFSVFVFGFTAAALTLFTLEKELLIAIGGSAAVAFGFAAKDLAASLLAGIIILVDRPFQVGDRVTFEGFYGEITSVGLRSVRLVTLDDTQVTIPNNRFLTEAVASGNAGAVDMMIQIDLHVGADQDLAEARRRQPQPQLGGGDEPGDPGELLRGAPAGQGLRARRTLREGLRDRRHRARSRGLPRGGHRAAGGAASRSLNENNQETNSCSG